MENESLTDKLLEIAIELRYAAADCRRGKAADAAEAVEAAAKALEGVAEQV